MSCLQLPSIFSRIGKRCVKTLGLKRAPVRSKRLEISAPFDFKEGPKVNLPGYSEDEISLMKEKAIASTAVVEDSDGEFNFGARRDGPRSLASPHGCGLGRTMVYHARKVSRGYMH